MSGWRAAWRSASERICDISSQRKKRTTARATKSAGRREGFGTAVFFLKEIGDAPAIVSDPHRPNDFQVFLVIVSCAGRLDLRMVECGRDRAQIRWLSPHAEYHIQCWY